MWGGSISARRVETQGGDIDNGLKTSLIDEYSNEKKPTEGELYRNIRQYHYRKNWNLERRWRGWLTAHQKRCLKQLLGHYNVAAALDALLDIPGLWGGMQLNTWHTITSMKCDDIVVHYLEHIKDVWGVLLLQDRNAMQLVDQATVKALEFRAPRVSTTDADVLRGQVLGGQIFSAFNQQDRIGIWSRLQAVDGLIPSLRGLFKNIGYTSLLADCIKRLITPLPGDTVSTALFHAFSDVNQRPDRAIIQVSESSFSSIPASLADRANLGCRQLYAFAMRHYLEMPRDPTVRGKGRLARARTCADETVLRGFADLAECLGFQSPEITALKQYPKSIAAGMRSQISKPLLVTEGAGVQMKRRCGLPTMKEYVEDGESLFINHLHDAEEAVGEGITSFYVRKSIYLAFFGKPSSLSLDSTSPPLERGEEVGTTQDVWSSAVTKQTSGMVERLSAYIRELRHTDAGIGVPGPRWWGVQPGN